MPGAHRAERHPDAEAAPRGEHPSVIPLGRRAARGARAEGAARALGARSAGAAGSTTTLAAAAAVRSLVHVPNADAMRLLGARLAMLLRAGDLVVLAGDLGAGKTTLTQGMGTGLGVRDTITSPTRVIARVHPSLVDGPPLVHVDAFRLTSLDEIDDLGLNATLARSITVVEWGKGLVEGLAISRLEVEVFRPRGDADGGADRPPSEGDEHRTAMICGFGPRWQGVSLPTSLA